MSSTDLRRSTSALSHVSLTYPSPIVAFCRHQSPGSAYQQTVDCWSVSGLFRSPARRPGMTFRKTWHQQNHWPHFVASSRLFRKAFPDYLLDINWLSLVDLAVFPLLRPPKIVWLIDWLIEVAADGRMAVYSVAASGLPALVYHSTSSAGPDSRTRLQDL